ncbi:hypothetical protein BNJ_00026 [Kaumoebavirus]|uniref:hypothetical protein n=1 Tax=Kaumoebavirus TaxID=1859492 RepID=UPI0009C2C5B6|nr:hypothetical protein BNJ_00026 [Kaumoebavirus]ARA71869.1 hypothetical protein BNJ_00026 [Kaumoebavirus]
MEVFALPELCLEISKHLRVWSFKSFRRTCRATSEVPLLVYREARCREVTGIQNPDLAEKKYRAMLNEEITDIKGGTILSVLNLLEEMDSTLYAGNWRRDLFYSIIEKFARAKYYDAKWKTVYVRNEKAYVVKYKGHMIKYSKGSTEIYVDRQWKNAASWFVSQEYASYSTHLFNLF